jgi:hypothetical protein
VVAQPELMIPERKVHTIKVTFAHQQCSTPTSLTSLSHEHNALFMFTFEARALVTFTLCSVHSALSNFSRAYLAHFVAAIKLALVIIFSLHPSENIVFHFFTRQNWVSIRVFALGPVKGIFNVTRIPARNAASAVSHHRCYDTNFGDKIQNMACSLAKRHITTAPLLNETLE